MARIDLGKVPCELKEKAEKGRQALEKSLDVPVSMAAFVRRAIDRYSDQVLEASK